MLRVLILLSLGLLCAANVSSPEVTVYTYKPIKEGEKNVLLCHAKEFNPPNIHLELLEGGNVMPKTNQSDITFEQNWKFKLTKYAEFWPKQGVEYSCRVNHQDNIKKVKLESF
ncbi:beta-2-microglobulin-like [Pristis pectinata]|uniref:beta-2-microglobulin-like n=1 Tax=Pristis pectinata TaxID=685728 RepID=UPI00223CD838|nr:beta-2-microglobulin-like [Pristis pectinata]